MRTSSRSLSPYSAHGITGNNSRFLFFVKMYLIAQSITDVLHFPLCPPSTRSRPTPGLHLPVVRVHGLRINAYKVFG